MPDGAVAAISAWVTDQLGLRYDEDRRALFERRLIAQFGDAPGPLRALRARIEARDPDTLVQIAEIASTNHTYFFREPEAFDALAAQIAPTLPRTGPIRVWSAAASSGEEAYSIASCLAGALGRDVLARLKVLGTDISGRQLRVAERAVYPRAALARVPERARRDFLAHPDGVQVDPALAAACTFRRLNLAVRPWPFESKFDVVFLRNVLYYFAPELRDAVVEGCYDVAAPGAWLVVGLTEPLVDLQTRWRPVATGLYRRERA